MSVGPFLISLGLGALFGFILQRVQASAPDRIIRTLTLQDLSILKFMLLAIGVGAAGVGVLTTLGLAQLSIKPLPLLAVILGGALFGVGFAVAGYCPGTCLVGAAEGRRDALFTVLGGLTGAWVFAWLFPWGQKLLQPLALGRPTLASVTGLAPGWAGVLFGALLGLLSLMLPARPGEPKQKRDSRALRWWEKHLLGVQVGQLPSLLPGLLLALGLAVLAHQLSSVVGAWVLELQGVDPTGKASPVSGIALAVMLGLLVANTIGTRPRFAPGVDFSIKKLLRLGIILVGLKLSVFDLLKVGALGIPVVLVIIVVGVGATLLLARAAKLSPRMGTLAAASTAICGITATLAVAPAVDADDKEVAYTVANVTLFGLIAMLFYPYLAHALFAQSPGAAGLFMGTAIHDTSQVMGAALSYKEIFGGEHAAQVATVAKLTRNAMLVAVVPVLALLHARTTGKEKKRLPLAKLFPMFVLGFVALSVLRSLGDWGLQQGQPALGVWSSGEWLQAVKLLGEKVSSLLLGTALAAVGLSTRLKVFRGLGIRPLLIGMGAAVTVGVTSLGLAFLVGRGL